LWRPDGSRTCFLWMSDSCVIWVTNGT
jgi:hypothetical protein